MHSTSLLAPNLPPDVQVTIDHDFNKRLLALGIYLTAIKLMIFLGPAPWDAIAFGPKGFRIWATGPGVWEKGYDVQIVIRNQQSLRNPLRLRIKHIVTGLWETMLQISEERLYYETVVTVRQDYREVGNLTIEELTPRATDNSIQAVPTVLSNLAPSVHGNLDLTQAAPVNSTANPTYPSGQVQMTPDPRSTVMYTYLGTTQIQSKDIFMAVLGLLADAAQYDPGQSIGPMTQVSPSGKCRITLIKTDNRHHIGYAYAALALSKLINAVMLPLEKFGAMDFWMAYENVKIVDGSVMALNPAPVEEE